MSWQKLYIVTTMPGAGAINSPESGGAGVGAYAFKGELGNVLEITAYVTASQAAGTLTLLRWCRPTDKPANMNPAGEWRLWREDAPIVVPSTGPGASATISGRYEVPENDTNYWLLFGSDSGYAGYTGIKADAQCVHYRGAK